MPPVLILAKLYSLTLTTITVFQHPSIQTVSYQCWWLETSFKPLTKLLEFFAFNF